VSAVVLSSATGDPIPFVAERATDGHLYVRQDCAGGGFTLRLSDREATDLRDALTAVLDRKDPRP
jgi:hypothetical protein